MLEEKVIEIQFINPPTKAKALQKLKNSLYRQEEHTDYIYVLVEIRENGRDAMSAQLPLEFKEIHQDFDLAMVMVDVPLGRKAEIDLIRIDNCPESFTKHDCRGFEEYLIN